MFGRRDAHRDPHAHFVSVPGEPAERNPIARVGRRRTRPTWQPLQLMALVDLMLTIVCALLTGFNPPTG